MKRKRINVLYQCDDKFAFMAGVSFASLAINSDKEAEYFVYVLTPDMSEINRRKWCEVRDRYSEGNIHLLFLPAEECQKEVNSWNVPSHRGSWVTYYKLLLARYFDESSGVDRIIHIGADTLVTGSLTELADFDFKGKPFAMNWSEKIS